MATATESFTKADGAGLGDDLTWSLTDPGSNWATASNVGLIDGETQSGEIIARAEFDTGSDDMYVQIVIPDFGNTSYGDIGLCVRVSADRQTRYTFKRITSSGGQTATWEIRKYIGGVLTELVAPDTSVPFVFPETSRIEVEGNEIRVYINDELIASDIDSDIAAGSFGGLDGFRNGDVANRRVFFDDFEVGSLTSAATDLTVQSTTHAHAVDNVTLVVAGTLVVADTTHAHTVDNVTLTQVHELVVQSTTHAHTVDSLSLTQTHELVVASTTHTHAVDSVTLILGEIITPAERTYTVPAYPRVYDVAAYSRTHAVSSAPRLVEVT